MCKSTYIYKYMYIYGSVSLIHGAKESVTPPIVTQGDPSWAIHRSPRAHMRQQTCLLCDTADMFAVTHQTCRLYDTADMSAVRHSRHVCCATHQTCLLCDAADMSAV